MQLGNGILGFCTVGGKGYGNAEGGTYGFGNLSEGELGVHFSLGLAHVAHDDKGASVGKYFLQGRKCAAYASVIGYLASLIEGHVEIYADNHF